MDKIFVVLAVVLSFFFVMPNIVVAAGNGNVIFQGKLDGTLNCQAFLNDGKTSDGTITLPTVSTSVLSKAGDVAGSTGFSIIYLCDCTPSDCNVYNPVRTYFDGQVNIEPSSGRLLNNASDGAAQNVQLQILDGQNNYTPIKIGDPSSGALVIKPKGKSADNAFSFWPGDDSRYTRASIKYIFKYAVQYYATSATTAGKVSSYVVYTLSYG